MRHRLGLVLRASRDIGTGMQTCGEGFGPFGGLAFPIELSTNEDKQSPFALSLSFDKLRMIGAGASTCLQS